MALSAEVEELLEQMIEHGHVESNSDAGRQALELLARKYLGDEHVDEVKRQFEGEESLTRN